MSLKTYVSTLLLASSLFIGPAFAAWESEMATFASQDALNPPPSSVILFTGSSSIRLWPSLSASFPGLATINRGFGGSLMSDAVTQFPNIVSPYHSPRIVLYEGDNDLAAGITPQTILAQFQQFADRLETELPGSELIVIAVKPSPSRANLLGSMQTLNGLLATWCEAHPRRRFADVFTPMLNTSGQPRPELFGSDMLHMNAAGYAIWQQVLDPLLRAAPYSPPSAPTAPQIVKDPQSLLAIPNQTVAFHAEAHGSPPFTVEWQRNGEPIASSNSFFLSLPPVSIADHGSRFRAKVTNAAGFSLSSEAQLSVASTPALNGPHAFLLDFGSTATPTQSNGTPDPSGNYWNNVTTDVGTSATGILPNLLTTRGHASPARLEMVARFNGANTNGTTSSAPFPVTATQDSLFGNTELFSGLSNVFPAFKVTGLQADLDYTFTFYASRMSVSDVRQTAYTVTGGASTTVMLNIANNIQNVISTGPLRPTNNGEFSLSLAPGPQNTNANHFTYLGVLKIEATPVDFTSVQQSGEQWRIEWSGNATLEWSPTASPPWQLIDPAPTSPYLFHPSTDEPRMFLRLRRN